MRHWRPYGHLWTGEYFEQGPDGAFANEILANLQRILDHAS